MKLATFERTPGVQAIGVVDTARAQILDLAQAGAAAARAADPALASMLALIESD